MRAQPPGDEEVEHAEIAEQRPYRVTEGRGPVALDRDMGHPGEGVADDRGGEKEPPVAPYGAKTQAQHGETRAEKVQCARARTGMGAQVARPEFGIGHLVMTRRTRS